MTFLHDLRQSEGGHLANLKKIQLICLAFKPNTCSLLDPMAKLCTLTENIARCLDILIERHSLHSFEELESVRRWFADLELLNLYNEILFGSIKLIYSLETPFFRLGKKPEFVICILDMYNSLLEYQRILNGRSTQLSSMIHAFEYQFKSSYNVADLSVLKLDQVHDLLSHTFDLVSPPLINLDDVAKRDYFRLSLSKHSVDRQLVEIFQFSNGEMAIFKVNSGELPFLRDPPNRLLVELSQGNYKLLDMGRTLLFPALREYDLEIMNILPTGAELRTTTGNDIVLKFQCVDALQWESHWKMSFKKLFDKKNVIQLTPRSTSSASLAKSSHLFQNFKLKHNKLEDLRPTSNTGLPIRIPQQTTTALDEKDTPIESAPPKSKQSGLHRSKPLQKPFSTLMYMKEEEEKRVKSEEVQLSQDSVVCPSFEDLEPFDCQKLLELDKGIQMTLSPVSLEAPVVQELKSVSQHSSLEKIGPISERDIEFSDLESAISAPDGEDDELSDNFLAFNPSAEFYKPTLYRRKSSSLLSLFSSKNKKGLAVDTAGANASTASVTSTRSNTPSSAKSDLPICTTERSFESLPPSIDLNNDLCIFESDIVRISVWDGKQWKRIGPSPLKLSILRTVKDESLLVVYEKKEDSQCILAAQISSRWKCHKAAAQDIQIFIPPNEFAASILPQGSNTLNIRSRRSEGLMNFLQHCIKGNIPGFMPSSHTAVTLSSAPSSYSGHCVTRSSTAVSAVTNLENEVDMTNSFLLLPSVKVKIHSRTEHSGWQVKDIGQVDIFSQDYKGAVVAIKFDIYVSDRQTNATVTLISPLDAIRRIGRTGLLIADENNEHLLEFMNKMIADQVYKLIKPL